MLPFWTQSDAAEQAEVIEKLDLKVEYGCELTAALVEAERAKYDLACVSLAVYSCVGRR